PQFTLLRETVLSHLSPGLQEHTMTAFWNYILLTELARKIVRDDAKYAHRDPQRLAAFAKLKAAYEPHQSGLDNDFSQRLLQEVERINLQLGSTDPNELPGRITQTLYTRELRELSDLVAAWLAEKDEVWVLVDNIDKGWPTRGATKEDIVIVRSLLEATRKLHRQLETRDVELNCLVFLRTDIYEL